MRTVHIITRMIIGGAQENTLHTVTDQHALHGDDVTLITGPSEGPEGSLIEQAVGGGFGLIEVPDLVRTIAPVRDLRCWRRLCDLLRDLQPQIVHTHSSKAGILGRAAAANVGIPCVHTIHGASFHYGQSPPAYRAYIAAEKWAARRTAHFISVADEMTDAYVKAGIAPRERFTTIYSGFDVEPFLTPPRGRDEVRRELGFAAEDVVIGKIARLFPLKGHEFVVRAARHVIDEHPTARFLLVGDGILRESIERSLEEQKIRDRFTFTGLVPPTRIPELIHAMDIVAHTSQWEGLARVLPQGLIAGKPVVSYDVGGAREVVIPGETGYLLPRNSVDQLAAAMGELIEDPHLRQRLGSSGRERLTERFRHQRMTAAIRGVYEQILSDGVGPASVATAADG
jgi:glycosyltransferase involved in cell wall biosynthesis